MTQPDNGARPQSADQGRNDGGRAGASSLTTIRQTSTEVEVQRRVVTAALVVDVVGVDFARVSSVLWAALSGVTPRVALEVTVGGDLLVIDEVAHALRRAGHTGPVHVRSSSAWAADRLACALDPSRPRTVSYPDPWATHDEGDIDG